MYRFIGGPADGNWVSNGADFLWAYVSAGEGAGSYYERVGQEFHYRGEYKANSFTLEMPK